MKTQIKTQFKIGAIFLIAILGLVIGYTIAQTENTFIISTGKYPNAVAYTISKEESVIYAKNKYGFNSYSGSNLSQIIINSLNSLNSGRTWIETIVIEGNYEITNPITIPSYTHLEINGIFILANNVNNDMFLVEQHAHHISFNNGEFNGNKANQNTGSLFRHSIAGNESYITFQNMHIHHFYQYGIHLSSGNSRMIKILKCKIHDNNLSGIRIAHNEVTVKNCEIYNNGACGILAYQSIKHYIAFNTFKNHTQDSIYFSEVTDSIVQNNLSEDARMGIYILNECVRISVLNNIIYSSDRMGIHFWQVNRSIIANNIIENSSQEQHNEYSGIRLENATYSVISNNIVSDLATYKAKYGIEECASESDYNYIAFNIVYGQQTDDIVIVGTNTVVEPQTV